jgi:hypothetical protein
MNMGEFKGRTGLSPHAAYPSTEEKEMQSPAPIYPGTSPVYIVTTQVPCSPQPYGSMGKELGRIWRHDEPSPVLSSNPQQTYSMNV